MKTTLLLAVIGLLGTACYSSTPQYADRYPDRRERAGQTFDAYTTDGQYVRVQQDARDGDLVIVDPPNLRGDTVAMVNQDNGQGYPMVAIQSSRTWRENDRDRDRERDHAYDEHRSH